MSDNGTQGMPPGWAKVALGDVLPLSYGKGLTEKQRDETGSVPVYGSSGIVGWHSQALTSGPTLVVGRKGSVGEVHYSPVPCWPIDTTYFVEATESTNLRFFGYLLVAIGLGQLDKSTTIPGLSRDDYNVIEVAVAPLPEQHRIVAEIEKQFTRLDAAVVALERARANLKRYRASVLKAACEGRLVPTEAELARTEGRHYEPADRLLARILRERRAKWEADQLAKMQAQGKVPKDDKWKDRYQEPIAPDTADLPEPPKGWVWTSTGQLCECIVPNRDKPKTFTGDIPWITLIVAEVERRLSVIDELEATVDANLRRAERLRQSILKCAFEGKLVPQDPNDEPASVLLKRIRAERALHGDEQKTTKKATSKPGIKGKRPQVLAPQGELFR